jgi:hypothetical protein
MTALLSPFTQLLSPLASFATRSLLIKGAISELSTASFSAKMEQYTAETASAFVMQGNRPRSARSTKADRKPMAAP